MCLQELRARVQDWNGGGPQDGWNDVAGGVGGCGLNHMDLTLGLSFPPSPELMKCFPWRMVTPRGLNHKEDFSWQVGAMKKMLTRLKTAALSSVGQTFAPARWALPGMSSVNPLLQRESRR